MGKRILGVLVLVAVMVCAPALFAQSGRAAISGRVTDPSGAVVPGVKVTATDVATGVAKTATTNGAGLYELQALLPGQYSVEALAPNFKRFLREGITLQVEDNLALNATLEVGAETETVTVNADVSGLRTEDAQQGEVINNEVIEDLPNIATGALRDPFALVTLAGNVQGGGGRAGLQLGVNGNQGVPDTRVNGGRTQATEYIVDGIPVTGGFVHNVSNATPTTEDVSEFKVITNGLSAEYGRLSGGALSIATQAGTNSIHGQVFEYNQNAYLNANNFQNTSQTPIAAKSNFRQNDFGGAAGGPVTIPHFYSGKNKTFWFANYEGFRNSQSGNVNLAQTITDAERTGDLRDIGAVGNASDPIAQVYDPYNYNPDSVIDPATGNPSYEKNLANGCPDQPGQCIPQAELNPVAQAYIKLLPHPNHAPVPGFTTAGNFSIRQPTTINQDNWSVRLDDTLSASSSVFARFSHNSGSNYTGPLNPILGTSSYNNIDGGYSVTLHFDHSFSPTTLLDLRFGANYNPYSSGTALPSNINDANLGFSSSVLSLIGNSNNIFNVHNGPFTEGISAGGNIAGGGQLWPMLQAADFNNFRSTIYDYAGSLTKVLGRHSLKFGYEGRRYFDNPTTSSQANQTGDGDGLAFTADAVVNQYFDGQGSTWTPQAFNSGLGQFLLGIDTWARITGPVGRSLAQNYYASYVQDDFKATPKLTLNLGFRWEMETPVTERHNNLSVWDPNSPSLFTIEPGYSFAGAVAAAGLDPTTVQTPPWLNGYQTGNLVLVGTPQHPARTATKYHPWNFSPRLGFAYKVTSKTVVRGSFALLYLPTSGNLTSYGDAPGVTYTNQGGNNATQVANYSSLPGQGLSNLSNLFTPPQLTTFQHNTYIANQQTAQSGVGSGGIDINSHMPMEADWGLSIQHEFPQNWLVEVFYSANSSTSLLAQGNPSHFPASLHTGGPTGANAKIYTTPVASPFGNQVPCPNGQFANPPCQIGATQNLGILEYPYPYYGPISDEDVNIGKSNYESATVRVEHRLNSGLYALFNYTFSKSLDDAGGADVSNGGEGTGNGTGSKAFQTVYDIRSSYGLSVFDITHRASLAYIYNLPFGRGRRWMNQSQGLGSAILQAVAGGWDFAGHTTWNSGTPISIQAQGTQIDSSSYNVYNYYTQVSLLPGKTVSDVFAKTFSGNRKTYVAYGGSPAAGSVGRFDPTAADSYGGTPQTNPFTVTPFTNGNLPFVLGSVRNPGNWTSDDSFAKEFPVSGDGRRYFQLRLESTNIFNHAGFGSYDNNAGHNTFGYVTGPANNERHLQVGGRFVF